MFDAIKRLFGFGGGNGSGAGSGAAEPCADPSDMIPCAEANGHLLEYLDDELDPATAEAVRKHLEACPECYPRARFEEQFLESIRQVKSQEAAGPELRDRILEALAREPDTE